MASFACNGAPVTVRDDHPHLLAALRDELGVISPKDGCAPQAATGPALGICGVAPPGERGL